MPWTQAVQLGIGVGVDGWRLWESGLMSGREGRDGDKELMQGRVVAVGLLSGYACLYRGQVREASRRRRQEGTQEGKDESLVNS